MTDITLDPIGAPSGQFASVSDVATRLGRSLSTDEADSVDLLLTIATATIANAADKDDEWAATLSPVPTILQGFCIELTCRAFANPEGLFSTSKTIGSYTNSKSFNKDVSSAMALSDIEVLVIRRAVNGTNAGSARAENVLDDLYVELDDSEGS